jgi:hypothetical protein
VVTALVRALELPLPAATDSVGVRRWVSDVTPQRVRDSLRLHFARRRAEPGPGKRQRELADQARRVLEVMRRRDPVTLGDLAIDGNDIQAELGMGAGPEVGRLLERCLDAVIENPALNTRDDLLQLVKDSDR